MRMKAVSVCTTWLLCINLLAIGLTPLGTLAADCDPMVGNAVSVQGMVEVRRVNDMQWQPVNLNDMFCAGDRIRVGDSRAEIALANRAVLRLDQNITITLGRVQKVQTFLADLIKAPFYFSSRATRTPEVPIASVHAGVEGTEGLIPHEITQTKKLFQMKGSRSSAGGQASQHPANVG
jgi:hypothetical protein